MGVEPGTATSVRTIGGTATVLVLGLCWSVREDLRRMCRGRVGPGEVAGGGVGRAVGRADQRGIVLDADRALHDRAARVEAAAGRDADRARRVAGDGDRRARAA